MNQCGMREDALRKRLTLSHTGQWCEHRGCLEQTWLCSQHDAVQNMVQGSYSQIFPAKTVLDWVSMGLLPPQTHTKLITSLICSSLQCAGAQNLNGCMPGIFLAHDGVSAATPRFQHCRNHPEEQRRALHGRLLPVLVWAMLQHTQKE